MKPLERIIERRKGDWMFDVNIRVIGNLIILWPPCEDCQKPYEYCWCGVADDEVCGDE